MTILLAGPNTHRKLRARQALEKRYSKYEVYRFSCTDEGMSVASLDTILHAVSLFQEQAQKLLYIQDFTAFGDQKYLFKMLERYMADTDTIFVLETPEMLRKNAKILKYLQSGKYLVQAEAYTDTDLRDLAVGILKAHEVSDASRVAQAILTRVEKDPFTIEHEAQKVGLVFQSQGNIDVELIVTKSLQYTIWEYLDSLTGGDRYKAIRIVADMLEKGENVYGIMAMVHRNLKMMAVMKAGSSYTDEHIGTDFGYHPYSVKLMRKAIGRYSLEKITLLYAKLVELDCSIKSGQIDPKLGLMLLSFAF